MVLKRVLGRLSNTRRVIEIRGWIERWRRRIRVLGEPDAATVPDVQAAIESWGSRCVCVPFASTASDPERPIFILATGWRTGSTLVQRICLTDPNVMVYGEPMGRAALVPRLTKAISCISQRFPVPTWELNGSTTNDLVGTFPANLYPPLSGLREALRGFFIQRYGASARAAGFRRWGIKEVRWSAAEALLLRWLFPSARIVVLTRHPDAVYASSSRFNYWYRWPDVPVGGGMDVVRHWNRLAESWADAPKALRHRIVKYERLVQEPDQARELASFLGISADPDRALARVTGGTPNKRQLSARQRRAVRRKASGGMQVMGYA